MIEITPLILSVVIEACVAAILVWRMKWASPIRAALVAAACTLVTQPLAWQGVIALWDPLGYWPSVALVEAAVWATEAFAYRFGGFSMRRSIVLSLVVNAASATIGFIS